MLVTVHILLLVINHVVLELTAKCVIGVVFVCHEFGFVQFDKSFDKLKDTLSGQVFRNLCDNFTATFNCSDNCCFSGIFVP